MANFSNIPTGLKIQSQIPLDVKKYALNEATLAYLGIDDNLAFTYHDGIEILCLNEKTLYKWREVQSGEENTGLIPLDFTYPLGLSDIFGINYSGKTYNFFQIEYITTENINENIDITNVGNGVEIYKGYNGTSNEHEFRTVVQEDQGAGESFLRDIQQTTDELKVRVKTLVSNNLTITATDKEVSIETPMTASIPALYVNNLYKPTYQEWLSENSSQNGGVPVIGFEFIGRGTLSAPFTDTVVYTLNSPLTPPVITVNTAIQNALDGDTVYSYVGSGTRLSPNKVGQKIKIQDNTSYYTFAGDFGYSQINLEIDANVASTTTGYLIDMDNSSHFNILSDRATISIGERYILEISGDGLNNSGTNIATNTEQQSRSIALQGEGRIVALANNITKYIINSDILSTGNNNDGALTFYLDGDIYAEYQGLIRIGGVSRVWNYGKIQSSTPNATINPALKAYLFLGGSFRSFQSSRLEFTGVRTDGFVFTPTAGFTPQMILQSTVISSLSTITNLFNKTTTDYVNLVINNSDSSTNLLVTNIFESPNLWAVVFNKNIFESGTIDNTKADLTVGNLLSVSNQIGANIIENLRIFNNRASAISAGVPLYSAYLKTGGIAYPTTAGWVRDIVLPS